MIVCFRVSVCDFWNSYQTGGVCCNQEHDSEGSYVCPTLAHYNYTCDSDESWNQTNDGSLRGVHPNAIMFWGDMFTMGLIFASGNYSFLITNALGGGGCFSAIFHLGKHCIVHTCLWTSHTRLSLMELASCFKGCAITWSLHFQVCQIGRKRSYPPRDEATVDQRRRDFVDERCGKRKRKEVSTQLVQSLSMEESVSPFGETTAVALEGVSVPVDYEGRDQVKRPRDESGICMWAAGFRPRSAHEHVRNCSQVDRGVKQHIVWTLARTLLETENWLEVGVSGIDCTKVESSEATSPAGASAMETQGKRWNRGGNLHFMKAHN